MGYPGLRRILLTPLKSETSRTFTSVGQELGFVTKNPLAHQLLDDKDGVYHKLVDQFYFEHHVHLGERAPWWGGSMKGTVQESLDLFGGLREKGIPAHFWP